MFSRLVYKCKRIGGFEQTPTKIRRKDKVREHKKTTKSLNDRGKGLSLFMFFSPQVDV